MQSVMTNHFSRVPSADIPRSSFNRTHGYKTCFDSGYLIPVFLDEALPGDTFVLDATMFARLSTPIVPFMDNIHLDVFYFAVPYRLIYDKFKNLCGEQVNPGDSVDYLLPPVTMPSVTGAVVGTLYDYLGVPTGIADLPLYSNLPARAYNLIWNEYFRDQNLHDSVVVDLDEGPDDPSDYVLLKRCKRYDFFTSCLPWPQKGDGVDIPMGDITMKDYVSASGAQFKVFDASDDSAITGAGYLEGSAGGNLIESSTSKPAKLDPNGTLEVVSVLINTLRESFAEQRMLERDARGGTRYIEILKSHFGVDSPDSRLQRPEYLGGSSNPIYVNPVAQTSSTDATTPQGNLSAYAAGGARTGFTKSFVEHCIVMGLVCVRADLTYQQGIPPIFMRSTRFDHYWPSFAHLGEQPVYNWAIYAQGPTVDSDADGTTDDFDVFGYQERYAEYRYKPSQITGVFRSTYPTSLDCWHLSQEFGSLPVLNSTFIEESPPIDRVQAVVTEPEFFFDSYNDLKCVRPMPVYAVPGMIDHF